MTIVNQDYELINYDKFAKISMYEGEVDGTTIFMQSLLLSLSPMILTAITTRFSVYTTMLRNVKMSC